MTWEITILLITLIVTTAVNVWKYLNGKRAVYKQQCREQQASIFLPYIKKWLEFFCVGRLEEMKDADEKDRSMIMFIYTEFTPVVIFRVKDYVIKSLITLRKFADENKDIDISKVNLKVRRILIPFEKVLFAMRKELGNDSKGLEQGDLLRLFESPKTIDQLINESNKIMNESKKYPY